MAAQFPRAQGGDFDLPLTTPHGATGRVGNFSPEGNHSSKCDLPSYLARRLSNQEKRRPIKSLQASPPSRAPCSRNRRRLLARHPPPIASRVGRAPHCQTGSPTFAACL